MEFEYSDEDAFHLGTCKNPNKASTKGKGYDFNKEKSDNGDSNYIPLDEFVLDSLSLGFSKKSMNPMFLCSISKNRKFELGFVSIVKIKYYSP